MKKQFLPYYISRAILSVVFALLVAGPSWNAAVFALVLFGGFLLYLHSGWFQVDLQNPFFPLRRDTHGQLVQRKALILAVVAGLLLYGISLQLPGSFGLVSGQAALSGAIVTYFIAQFVLFVRA